MGLSIHIGAHKTASTYLERSIWTVEEQLMDHGYMFLSPTMLRNKPLQLNKALANRIQNRKSNDETRSLLRGILAENDHVLISEEQILGSLGSVQFLGDEGKIYLNADKRLLLLLQMLNTANATIYLSLRSPASFLTSAFGEHFAFGYKPADGHLLTPEAFLGDFNPARLQWSELVERLLKTKAARIVCWRFEDLVLIKGKILQHMLNEELASQITELPLVRPGMTQAAYDMIVAQADGPSPKKRRHLVKRAMAEHPKESGSPSLRIFDETMVRNCDAAYAQDCQKIASMPGVEFIWPDRAI